MPQTPPIDGLATVRRSRAIGSIVGVVVAAVVVAIVPVAIAVAGGGGSDISACCLPDGTCSNVPAGFIQCETELGGILAGPGTDCSTVSCVGACCFSDTGECFEGLGVGDCDAMKGTFGGLGSDCEPTPCGLITGTCCLPDGSCVGGVSENNCAFSLGGTWSLGGDCTTAACCRGDLDQDGQTGFSDVVLMLGRWGVCSPALACREDLNQDGLVGFSDLTVILSEFGCGP